ncbi:MAG: M3 family oligoendopeptidase [Deltaproteobacteria bacterium]|nr:M3 family oligoendopeptidase [Deltaproteobacteria bacterium]
MKNLTLYPTKFFKEQQQILQKSHVEVWLKKSLAQFEAAKTLDDWEAALVYFNEVKIHIETHLEKATLAFHRFTQDTAIDAELKRLQEEIEPPYKAHSAPIRQKILHSPFRKELEQKYSIQYFNMLQLQEDSFNPANIETETQLNHLLNDYTKLTGNAEFEVGGQKYPLAHYRRFATSPDAALRKEAFHQYGNWFLENRDSLEKIYDECVGLRNGMGKKLGYDNFTLLGYQHMRRVDYGPKEVAAFREQIKKVLVPLASKIRAVQAKMLSASTCKAWDSEFFPEWRVEKIKLSIPQQIPAAHKVFSALSPVLGNHFKRMVDCELLDLEARNGKAPGAFCTDLSDYRVPYIFLNSVGEASDITTVLHESGHAFQAWESRTLDLMELRWPSLEACEVHSMGMEFLAYPYYEEFFHATDAARYKKFHLAESILLLPYIAMVDEFQHRVYSGNAQGAEGRAKVWEELERTYLPDLDYEGATAWRRIRWLRQLHIFKHPFYYIDYAIALTGALQLWVQSIQNKERALENYLSLCKIGGTKPLKEFFAHGNLKLPFEDGMLADLVQQVLKIENLL